MIQRPTGRFSFLYAVDLCSLLCQDYRISNKLLNTSEVKPMLMRKLLLLLTNLSSRKFISQWTGKFAKSSMSKFLIPKFAKMYGIRIEDAEKELHEYSSLNDFFTRRLKEGLRQITSDTTQLISPVDCTITGMGEVDSGKLINVKGQDYIIQELLNHSPRVVNYKHGFYFVMYLSPSDYHRIHAPVTGNVIEKEHVPGKVFPVNDYALRNVGKVLSRNERLITYMQHDHGELCLVKVGALNVSSIQYIDPKTKHLERGAEFAYFEFGSTVVLLLEADTFECNKELMIGSKLQMGQSLGSIVKKSVKS